MLEYAPMLLRLRKFLFYLLVAVYFLVTPYAILYALGYIFNPAEKALVKTGLISVQTEPRGATVYVQGKKFSEKSPTTIQGLLPGRYDVRMVRKGFKSWQKQVEIYPEKATKLEHVVLLAQRPSYEVIGSKSYQGLVPLIEDSRLYAWEGKTLDSLWRIDLLFKKEIPSGRAVPEGPSMTVRRVYPRKDADFLLFKVQKNGTAAWIAYDLDNPARSRDLSDLIPPSVDWISWPPKSADQIYFLSKGTLARVDLRRGVLHDSIAQNVLGFGFHQNDLILLKQDYSLEQADFQGRQPEPLIRDSRLLQSIFAAEPAAYYRVQTFKRDFLQKDLYLFLSDRGELIFNRLPYRLVDAGVLGLRYAQESEDEKILFWTKQEIGIVDFTRHSRDLFEQGPVTEIPYREGTDIRQAFWAFDDTHILFVDGNRDFLVEAAGPSPFEVRALDEIAPGSKIIYREKDHAIYYLDPSTRQLLRRKLTE